MRAFMSMLVALITLEALDSLLLYPEQASHPNNRFLKRSLVDEALGAEHQMLKVPSGPVTAARAGVEKRRAFVSRCHSSPISSSSEPTRA